MTKVLASYFDDDIGMRDNNLYDGGYYYSELSIDYKKGDHKALGGLPFGHPLTITYNGKSAVVTKADVGNGGPNNPKIDIHKTLADAIGFPSDGLDYVYIS